MRCSCDSLIKAIDVFIEKSDKNLEKKLREDGFEEPKKTVDWINMLEFQTVSILANQNRHIRNTLSNLNDIDECIEIGLKTAIETDKTAQSISNLYSTKTNDIAMELSGKYAKKIDVSTDFKRLSYKTQKHTYKWSKQLGELMQENQYKTVSNILRTSSKEGLSIAQATQLIKDSGIRNVQWRARRVAMTEVLRSHNVANYESMIQSVAVKKKKWLHTGAGIEPRLNHLAINGQEVKVDEPFTLTGIDGSVYYPMFPLDPILPASESINCHCMMTSVIDYEKLALPQEEKDYLNWQKLGDYDEINQGFDFKKEYSKIAMKEPYLTKDMKNIVKGTNGELVGLEHRLKTQASTMEKIDRKMNEIAESGAKLPSRKQVFENFKDIVRYTSQFDEKTFTENFVKTSELLSKKGYNITKVKNTWYNGVEYKGINCTVFDKKRNLNFEMQFHTKKSLKVKNKIHLLYEEQRKLSVHDKRYKQLSEQMKALSETIPNPKGVETIK